MKIHHRSPRLWRIPVSGRPCCPDPSASKLRWWIDDFQILMILMMDQFPDWDVQFPDSYDSLGIDMNRLNRSWNLPSKVRASLLYTTHPTHPIFHLNPRDDPILDKETMGNQQRTAATLLPRRVLGFLRGKTHHVIWTVRQFRLAMLEWLNIG